MSTVKKDAIVFIIVGIVIGAVGTYIVTSSYYEKRSTHSTAPQNNVQAVSSGETKDFDMERHSGMIEQVIAKAKSDPKDLNSRIMLANIYYDRAKFSEAIKWYEEAEALDNKNTNVIVDLGICYYNAGKHKEAVQQFEKALKIEPGKKEALYNEAIVFHFGLKDSKKAKEVLSHLKNLFPDDPLIKDLTKEIGE